MAENDSLIKKADALIDRAFEVTGLPSITGGLAGGLGSGIDYVAGTNVGPTMEKIGTDVPRMVAEGLLTIPEVGSVGGAPVAALTWANRIRKLGQIVGYGSAAAKGYAETDSPLGALVAAGGLGVGNKLFSAVERGGLDIGGRAAGAMNEFLGRKVGDIDMATARSLLGEVPTPELASSWQRLLPVGARAGADIAAGTALNEVQRQAQMSVGPNAVPWDDASRNPLTPENIASNAVGAAMFAPGAVQAFRDRPNFVPKQVAQAGEWVQTREALLRRLGDKYDNAKSWEGPVDGPTYRAYFGDKKSGPDFHATDMWAPEDLFSGKGLDRAPTMDEIVGTQVEKAEQVRSTTLLKTQFDALRQQVEEGSHDYAKKTRESIANILENGSDVDAGQVQETAKALDAQVRLSPPEDVKGFARFVRDHNDMIDMINENTHEKLTDEEKTAKGIGVTWHPNARDPLVVNRLAEKGFLPKITPESLKGDFDATFNESGDAQFSYQVVLQKAVNRTLDNLPAALAKEKATPAQVTTDFSPKVEKARMANDDFVNALNDLQMKAPEVWDDLLNRTKEVFSRGARIADRGNMSGRLVDEVSSWRQAVVQAAKSYDPESKTVLVRGQKGFNRSALSTLVGKDENGRYFWYPKTSAVPIGEGGKPAKKFGGKTVPESNLEDLNHQVPSQGTGESHDEAEFRQAIEAEQGGTLLKEGELPTKVGVSAGEERVPEIGSTVPDFLKSEKSQKKAKSLTERKAAFDAGLAQLDDTQLYRLSQEFFDTHREGALPSKDRLRIYRSQGALRAALDAAFESFGKSSGEVGPAGKKFLEMERARGKDMTGSEGSQLFHSLRVFFGSDVVGKVGDIVKKVSDPQAITAAKGETVGAEPLAKEVNTLTNTTPPGSFVKDVHDTLGNTFYKVLGEQGYSGTLRDLYTNMGVAIAKTLDNVPTDFYRVTGEKPAFGLAKLGEDDRGKVGLSTGEKVVPGQEIKYVNRILDVLAHEISHIDSLVLHGLIDAPDAYSQKRRTQLENLRSVAQVLTPDERASILTTLSDAFNPQEMQKRTLDAEGKPYGTNDPEEFVAEVNGTLVRSLLGGKKSGLKDALASLDYSPTEVREYSQGTFRTIYDVLQGMKDSITQPGARQELGLPALPSKSVFTSEALHSVINAAREGSLLRDADRSLMQARAYTASLSQDAAGAPPLPSPAMWERTAEELGTVYSPKSSLGVDARLLPSAAEGITLAKDFLNAKGDPTKGMQPGLWARWFYPFSQLMYSMERSGAPLARPVANLALDLQAGITRTRSAMLRPFTIVEKGGKIHFDQDNVLIKKLSEEKSGPWRDAVNAVSAWQQENKTQSMFVQGKDGIEINTQAKGAQESWDKIRSRLSLDDQQVVQGTSVALDQTSQIAAQRLVASIDVSNRMRVASLLMALDRTKTYDVAKAQADGVVGSMMRQDAVGAQRALPDVRALQAVSGLLSGPDGLLGKFNEVQEKLLNRPGFRTESLPGDFVLRFKTPDGQIKYLSADSKHKALFLARKLTGEGNTIAGEIVNKSELRDYADFDSPDAILQKFTEVEGDVWNKFVTKFEGEHGAEAEAALRDYSPGAATLKELSTKGMNSFLSERQSKVDRSRYDYIDGTMSWVSRLATSMEYRSTRQMKDLILNDPRAKAFPSFKGLVDPHFDNLMTPTSQLAKELKTFSTAYMMGGSLASAVMNGTQSVTSLIPTLIQLSSKGGPAEAYGILGKAVAKAASVSMDDSWLGIAKAAETIPPEKWTLEQSQAALYKRNVEDGGINHGIIQDNIFSGSDQRSIMTSKFGHGDYGPVTKGELARNGVYLASQLALKPFGWIESLNNKVALFSGIEQGYSQGLRGEELYQHAKLVKTLSTYGGGKANAPGLVPKLSTPYTRSAVGIVNTLQQYGYGAVASYAQLVKDSLGKSAGISVQERRQAQKAFGTMFATQVAIGGALGLPFAAASLTVLEKLFGIPANQLVRQGLASLGQDEEQGATIAETALNGIGNQMFGLDVSSRVGVSSILGTSSYKGFNLQDMTGPVGSIVGNAAEALNLFGQGEPVRAMTALVPNALRNAVELSDTKAKYGDYGMRDNGGNLLYQPTTSQAAAYVLGFRPSDLSQKKQAQKMLAFANERATTQRGRQLDQMGESLLQGDPGPAYQYAQDARFNDPTVDPKSILRSVVQRSVDSVTEKDLLAQGPSANEGERSQIAGTFGAGVVSRQSEIQRAQLTARLGAQLGLPVDPSTFQRAALVDMLVQTRGMPRSQAVRLAEFLQ